jgi:hypothetical protein
MREAIALAFIAALGCGGSSNGNPGGAGGSAASSSGPSTGGPHGCSTIQASCLAPSGYTCEELGGYDAASVANFMASCNHVAGSVWSTSPCDRTGSVGGCQVAVNGACGVIWSFAPITASELQSNCVGQSQVFVTP